MVNKASSLFFFSFMQSSFSYYEVPSTTKVEILTTVFDIATGTTTGTTTTTTTKTLFDTLVDTTGLN